MCTDIQTFNFINDIPTMGWQWRIKRLQYADSNLWPTRVMGKAYCHLRNTLEITRG